MEVFRSDILSLEWRTEKGKLPDNPAKVLDILMNIHKAIIDHASSFYSSTESKEPEHTIIRIKNDRCSHDILGEPLHVSGRKEIEHDPITQKLRQTQALDCIQLLEESINLNLWGEKERPTPELRRRYILNSIIQAFHDRMDPDNKEDRPEIENAWFALGMFLLDRVSGAMPLEYKNPLTPWILPIIGEASKMLIRGMDNIQRKILMATSGYKTMKDCENNQSFKDIYYLSSTNTGKLFDTFGRMGMFGHYREASVSFFGRDENRPTQREVDFFRVVCSLPLEEYVNRFDPETIEKRGGICIFSNIMDMLLDYRIFSEPLFLNSCIVGDECSSLSSTTYYSFFQIIEGILDDEEDDDSREFAREIIRCMMICVNRFWASVKNDSKNWWRDFHPATNRTEELFKHLVTNTHTTL